jgi:L-ascorbate metabolism protein UlaG (beta-lactamase superfamily)
MAMDDSLEAVERAYRERVAALEEGHRTRRTHRGSFLALWARSALRPPRAAVREPLPAITRGELGVTFIGHATFLLRWAGARVLTDPNFERWLLGLRRAWEPGLVPAEIDPVDLVLVSHAHLDHLVRPSLGAVSTGATCVVPPRCADLVSDLGFAEVVELEPGETTRRAGVEVIAVPARHWGARLVGDGKRRGYGGYIVRGTGPSCYFAGDTAYFSGFAEIGRRYAPDVALLPIGAYMPPSFRDAHLSPLDAVYAFEDLGARLLVPMHYGSFALSQEPLDEPPRWLEEIVRERGIGDRVRVLGNGQSHIVRAE